MPIIRRLAQICTEKGQDVLALVDDNNNQRKQTALHWACTKNELAAVIVLIELGANPNLPDVDGYTPILTAIQVCFCVARTVRARLICAQYDGLAIVHYLSEHGGRMDALDNEGQRVLHDLVLRVIDRN